MPTYSLATIRQKARDTKARLKAPWLAVDEGDSFGQHLYGCSQVMLEDLAAEFASQTRADVLAGLLPTYMEVGL